MSPIRIGCSWAETSGPPTPTLATAAAEFLRRVLRDVVSVIISSRASGSVSKPLRISIWRTSDQVNIRRAVSRCWFDRASCFLPMQRPRSLGNEFGGAAACALAGGGKLDASFGSIDPSLTTVEIAMSYTLEQFCAESRASLQAHALDDALAEIAQKLSRLLAEPAFVSQAFDDTMPPGKTVLHHDPELDFYVLAHVQEGGKTGKPHSHGASWAVYGNARNVTEMTEWRRVNPESEDHAELIAASRYSLGPGQTKAYGPGVIH